METLFQNLDLIFSTINERSDELKRLKTIDREYTDGCLDMIFNKAIIAFEQLKYYENIWKETNNLANDQNSERCIDVTRMLFIGVISCIEFNIRKIVALQSNKGLLETINRKEKLFDSFEEIYCSMNDEVKGQLKAFRKKLKDLPPSDPISQIIKKSKSEKLIDELDYQSWDFIFNMRNIMVHNNGIASKNAELEFEGRKYYTIEGEGAKGDLAVFLVLTRLVTELFCKWVNSIGGFAEGN